MSTMTEKTQEEVEFIVSNRKRLLTIFPNSLSNNDMPYVLYASLQKQPFK